MLTDARMKRSTALLTSLAIFGLAVAHAAPNPPLVKKIRAPGAFSARLGQTVQKNGQSLTRQQIIEKFDADAAVDLGGSKITAQELMDRIDASEKHVASTKSASLTH